MKKRSRIVHRRRPVHSYRGADIPMSVIRRFGRQVAARFCPERIILFGSYACGKPHADSDVDILVIMSAKNSIDQAIRIRQAIDAPFPLDLIVRTPDTVARAVKEDDWFLREVVGQGKVLYEKGNKGMAAQSRRRLPYGPKPSRCKNRAS